MHTSPGCLSYFRFPRSRPIQYSSLISKLSGPVLIGHQLSCRSDLTGAPGGMSRKRRADLLEDRRQARNRQSGFSRGSLSVQRQMGPGPDGWNFAGAQHHPAYWLGTSFFHRGQERALE